jgi:hypothetical protein
MKLQLLTGDKIWGNFKMPRKSFGRPEVCKGGTVELVADKSLSVAKCVVTGKF